MKHWWKVAVVLLLSACSSTRLVSSWQGPAPAMPVRSVLVLGISKEDTSRRLFEDRFVQALRERGVAATAMYTLDARLGELPEAELRARVRQSGRAGRRR